MGQGWGQGRRLSFAERLELGRRVRDGERFEDAAAAIGCSAKSVQRLLVKTGGIKPRTTPRSARRLSLSEREEISRGLQAGRSSRAIASLLTRSASTVTREIAANGGRERYRAWHAQERSHAQARRPKMAKLALCGRLRAEVEARLEQRWSPQQIAARLIVDHPDDLEMRVSHETIYQSLFVQARGALRKELTAALRTGRSRHRPHRRTNPGGGMMDMVLLADRPAEVEDRAVPGHWEGDLIVGKNNRSAIATLVERQSRFVMLVGLDARTAPAVRAALTAHVSELPRAAHSDLDLGPRQRDGRPRRVHHRHRDAGLLLRPAITLATRLEREHQRPAAPVPPQEQRPLHPRPRPTRRDRRRAQRTTSTDPRLDDTI